jgi:hypothetical protein
MKITITMEDMPEGRIVTQMDFDPPLSRSELKVNFDKFSEESAAFYLAQKLFDTIMAARDPDTEPQVELRTKSPKNDAPACEGEKSVEE